MDFEKLGAFYLGKEYSLDDRRLLDRLVMYDSRDLTTHAVCIGMTGSGKTGLCVDLLEEAAIDGVPAIIIDPKGDITNRLLMFPDLAPEDFLPWINPDDARRKGMSPEAYAAHQAESWKNGLASWGQDGARIRMLCDAVDLAVYTPGSDAGIPVSVIQSFSAPALSWDTDAELLREKISGTVTALLGLIKVAADPLSSREHILLSSLFEHFWRQGKDLDLITLIQAIRDPPFARVGAFDIETFFPAKERLPLAMRLNHIVAAPAFQSWMNGQPLEIPGFLSTKEGKPRHAIFYLAHLNDDERMFFVTLLLYQLLSWVRSQTGTTSLRALLYMDEIFGFFPPVANPPSKEPMLTLLKQARAFGLGVVLTTQNPVDLDYKGLSNTGTWFIGRLQTVQDRNRVLDGLEGAVQGGAFSRAALSEILSSLDNRVFLLHNVHESAPLIFQTRWAMSYLRGPLSREQVRVLMKDQKPDAVRKPAATPPVSPAEPAGDTASLPPALPPDILQRYLPVRVSQESAAAAALHGRSGKVEHATIIYEPAVAAAGRVHYTSPKLEQDAVHEFSLLAPFTPDGAVAWERAVGGIPGDLSATPSPGARFSIPAEITRALKKVSTIQQNLVDSLVRSQTLKLATNPAVKLVSGPGEPENEFLLRVRLAARERRDAEVDALRKRYEVKIDTLEDRLRKAGMTVERKRADADARKREAMISAGESVIGVLMGRKSIRSGSAAASKYRQSSSAGMSAREAEENARALEKEIRGLKEEFERETAAITARWENTVKETGEIIVKPKKTGIDVTSFFLAWIPRWQLVVSDGAGHTWTERIDASR
ncbi:MAG TPA: type IV secretion system DNA-binding domain-containing protein [Methanoregulaceae archaeon]|nr:MAG: type IV secretion system DNA-binding domain-containing protein [Methanolinea sp.]HON82187.1 type IV secretion system DNA-binding domain-containing protein [Methanoregulaceae archaeon]HPD10929.1 type IV secretion system DNA-binding domain-containing protein [Methanoregulaceae archaeon]HRT16073.1 type IV secretion system DNA-binding domain-containing protein [Methanoregulaceae archaeon]HRU31579.1 type IV secretion system DNA-binding domain-containing protein [Methanoregulaceae archaeon]